MDLVLCLGEGEGLAGGGPDGDAAVDAGEGRYVVGAQGAQVTMRRSAPLRWAVGGVGCQARGDGVLELKERL